LDLENVDKTQVPEGAMSHGSAAGVLFALGFSAFTTFVSADTSIAQEVSLPADVASGWHFSKSLPNGFKRHGFQVVDQKDGHPIRLGSQSIRFEVRPGDCSSHSGWDDCANDRERHELIQRDGLQREDDVFWFAWSLFVPADYPNVYPTKTALGQFNQIKNNVIWMFQNMDGGYYVDDQVPGVGSSRRTERIVEQSEFQGRWIDLLVHAKFTSGDDGFFKVYVDHALKFAHAGQTMAKGDQSPFKFGIYRSFISRYLMRNPDAKGVPTQIAYYDEVRKGRQLSDADRVGIATLQEHLAEKGFYTSGVDGRWGPATRAATNAWLNSLGRDQIADYDEIAFSWTSFRVE